MEQATTTLNFQLQKFEEEGFQAHSKTSHGYIELFEKSMLHFKCNK